MSADRLTVSPPAQSAKHGPKRSQLITAEAMACALPPLLVAAERVAAIVSQGVHGRRRVGQGESFWQFRNYQPGDPTGLIDWRQSGKSDRVYLRQTEWEAAQSVWLWHDRSESMRYRSAASWPTKLETAELILLALSSLLIRGGERVHLLGQAPVFATGSQALHHLAHALAASAAGERTNLPPVEPLPRYARVVLFGDFLAPLDAVMSVVQGFAYRGVRGHLFHIYDPSEQTLPFSGRVVFTGCEDEGEALFGRVEDIREAYRGRFLAHQEGLRALSRAAGWSFLTHSCDQPLPLALLALYLSLSGSTPG